MRDAVFKAAAFNFFQAIHEGRLVVEVVDSEEYGVLDAVTLRDVLSPYRDELRSGRTGAFLSGRKANEAYETLVDGETYEIGTAQGNVAVRLLRRESGRRSVGLCRNGMWITEELPRFQNAFADRHPFQALILLSSDREDPFFELIREAETPLHDKLAPKQMEPVRRKALGKALREIRDGIAALVPASTEEVYIPKDILAFQFENVEGQGRGGRQPSLWGQLGNHATVDDGEAEGGKARPRRTRARRQRGWTQEAGPTDCSGVDIPRSLRYRRAKAGAPCMWNARKISRMRNCGCSLTRTWMRRATGRRVPKRLPCCCRT